MEKAKSIMAFVDNLLGKFRRVFVNILTVLLLMLITLGIFGSLDSLFQSDEIETKDQILYLEPNGVIVDKAISRNDPFEEFEIFGSSTNQIELENILKVINNAGTDDNLKAIYLDVDGLRAYYTSALKIADALFEARLAYTTQILIAKKITENLSLQLSPSFIHRNWVPQSQQNNQTISIGLGGRYKLTKRFSINGEYFYVPKSKQDPSSFNSLSLGVDIETGGHVFQLHFTNSTSMIERGFITETNNSWLDGDIHFGFNVSRVFSLKSNTSLYE